MICPFTVLEAKIEYKMNALEKHMRICQELKIDILKLQDQRGSLRCPAKLEAAE